MEKLIKNRDFWVVMAIVIFGFYIGFFRELFWPANFARLEIDFGDRQRAFEGEIASEMSVLDALLAASRGGGFEIRYAILTDATDIMKINGLTEDGLNGKNWVFYLNGRKIETSRIHRIMIGLGDKIIVRFE